MECVKNIVMKDNLVSAFDPRKVCNKLWYQREKAEREEEKESSAPLPLEEESSVEHLERIGLVTEEPEKHSELTESPFTEAGSSVCTGRYTFSPYETFFIQTEF